MPAALRILDTDETTVTTTENLGSVNTPGTSTELKLFVENYGDQTAEDVTLAIVALGTNDGDDYAQIAPDVAGTPGTWQTDDLDLGDIDALEHTPFWTRAVIPTGITADSNPRRYQLDASGFTV